MEDCWRYNTTRKKGKTWCTPRWKCIICILRVLDLILIDTSLACGRNFLVNLYPYLDHPRSRVFLCLPRFILFRISCFIPIVFEFSVVHDVIDVEKFNSPRNSKRVPPSRFKLYLPPPYIANGDRERCWTHVLCRCHISYFVRKIGVWKIQACHVFGTLNDLNNTLYVMLF